MDLEGTSVTQLMTAGVRTVTPDTAVTAAAATLLEEDIGSVIVVDDENRPVGILTITDLARIVSTGELGGDATVSEHMTDEIVSVTERESVRDAAARMLINGIHHLPVTDGDGELVGMLSTMDLTAYFSYTRGSETE